MSDRKEALAADITATRQELLHFLEALGEEDWQRVVYPGRWTVWEVVAHLANAGSEHLVVAGRILKGEERVIPGFDIDRWNARQLEKRRGQKPAELLRDLEQGKQQALEFLRPLREEDLGRRGKRATGVETSLEEALALLARHERQHLEDLKAALYSSPGDRER